MAEYAGRRRCVRAAAGGFSPEHGRGMPKEKALIHLDLLSALERRRLFFQRGKGMMRQIMPRDFLWQTFHRRQKRKFF